jgi:hypothetical protein
MIKIVIFFSCIKLEKRRVERVLPWGRGQWGANSGRRKVVGKGVGG